MTTRILLADDHEIVLDGVHATLKQEPEFEIFGKVTDGGEAARLSRELIPDIVVMDLSMPNMSGIEATRLIVSERPAVRVLCLSMHADRGFVMAALEAGASGYVLKRVDAAGLVDAVVRVGNGERLFGEVLDSAVAARVRSNGESGSKLDLLSEQEGSVLELLTTGKSNKQIASEMFLSDKTVKNYVSHILAKLGVASRAEAAAYAADVTSRNTATYPAEDWPQT